MTDESPLAKGLRLREAHRWKAAASAFERAVDADPGSSLEWFWLAVTRDNRGEEERAIPAYRKALELELPREKAAQAWTWLASSLSKTGEPAEALASLRKADDLGGYRPLAEYEEIRSAVERRGRRRLGDA